MIGAPPNVAPGVPKALPPPVVPLAFVEPSPPVVTVPPIPGEEPKPLPVLEPTPLPVVDPKPLPELDPKPVPVAPLPESVPLAELALMPPVVAVDDPLLPKVEPEVPEGRGRRAKR